MWGLLDQNTQAAISILGWKTGSLLMEVKCDLWAGFLLCSCPAVSVPYWTALSAVCPSVVLQGPVQPRAEPRLCRAKSAVFPPFRVLLLLGINTLLGMLHLMFPQTGVWTCSLYFHPLSIRGIQWVSTSKMVMAGVGSAAWLTHQGAAS